MLITSGTPNKHFFKYLNLDANHLYLSPNRLYLLVSSNDLKIGINDLYLGSNDLYLLVSSNTAIKPIFKCGWHGNNHCFILDGDELNPGINDLNLSSIIHGYVVFAPIFK